tara:strand:- start:1569 stop:1904 length:336 start_codon:yes stop_codon:yes gene_type:complete
MVMGATSHGLVRLLFEELSGSLKSAEFYIEHGDEANMRKSLSKASRILAGLQGSLDFEKGGEIATNLAELYRFCIKELFKANTAADKETISSVRALIAPIQQAWSDMPQND